MGGPDPPHFVSGSRMEGLSPTPVLRFRPLSRGICGIEPITRPASSGAGAASNRFVRWISPRPFFPMFLVFLGCLSLSGCCSGIMRGLFVGRIPNGSEVVRQVEKTKARDYADALEDVIDVVSCINTGCPPKRENSGPGDAPSPVELDFNLLHAYLGPDDRVRLSSVPTVNPEEVRAAGDIDRVYGISESDNFKFVVLPYSELYVYIFRLDAAGGVEWYYPKMVRSSGGQESVNPWPDAQGVNPVESGVLVLMPGDRRQWLFFGPKGRNGVENFFLVASRARQIGLEEALGRAVQASQKEREANPSTFAQTLVRLPLYLPGARSGVVDPEGTVRRGVRAVATPQGPMVYGARYFESPGDTVVLVRSVVHLPPRSP